ncbi:MAG: hypothetical protein II685_02360 [Clostridia bacterium]|nr:hypothetical protein [Clostridia bacterium]
MELAYRIYPLPNGTVYTEENVKTLDDVIDIFDYCQIMEAMISKQGWDYLIEKFGIEGLYQADKKSGWFDSDSLEKFICDIEYEKSVAYEDEKDHKAITDFCKVTHFPAP